MHAVTWPAGHTPVEVFFGLKLLRCASDIMELTAAALNTAVQKM